MACQEKRPRGLPLKNSMNRSSKDTRWTSAPHASLRRALMWNISMRALERRFWVVSVAMKKYPLVAK
jgi:hypothetical protein